MAAPSFDKQRAIKVLVDAEVFGVSKACKRWGCTDQTVRNYRKRLLNDPEFLEALGSKQQELLKQRSIAEAGWLSARTRSLRKTLKRADALIANETDLDKVTRYLDKVGNLDIVSGVLGVGVPNPGEDQEPAEDAGRPGQEEASRPDQLQ